MSVFPNETLAASFNQLAGKAVSFSEYSRKESQLLSQNLTIGERLFGLTIDNANQLLQAVVQLPRILTDAATDKAQYHDPEKPLAVYLDAQFLAATELEVYTFGFNKSYQEKALGLRLQAITECEDVTPQIKAGKLKPGPGIF
jgi:hypothetical protein